MTRRPQKANDVLQKVHRAIRTGQYRDTIHSAQRELDRNIDLLDIIEVLENGYHEKRKDEFKEEFQSWNYSIRGKTFEGRELRIAVYFEESFLMIATVIDLNS